MTVFGKKLQTTNCYFQTQFPKYLFAFRYTFKEVISVFKIYSFPFKKKI